MLFFNVLKSLSSARGLANIRRDFPCFFPAVFLILGQYAALQFTTSYATLVVIPVALALLRFKGRRFFYVLLAIYLSGIVSTLINSSNFQTIQVDSQSSYLAYVSEEPRFRRPGQVQLSLDLLAEIETSNRQITTKKLQRPVRTLCRAVHLPWRNINTVHRGSYLVIRAQFRELRPGANPFAYSNSLLRRSYSSTCTVRYASKPLQTSNSLIHKSRHKLTSEIQQVLGRGERSGLILSMAFGKKDKLSVPTERAFKEAGLAHLMVVSGYHVTLVFGLTFFILKYIFSMSNRLFLLAPVHHLSSIIALLVTIFYVAIVGVSGSSMRAASAILIFVLARLWERDSGIFGALTVSAIFVSSLWPGAFLELGVQLTYGALLGICLALSRSDTGKIKLYCSVCFWASYTTSVIILIWFEYISLVGFVSNPLFAPVLAFFACKTGILSVLALIVNLDTYGLLLQGTSYILLFLRDIIIFMANLPMAAVTISGIQKYLVVSMMTFFFLLATARELRKYCLRRNIWVG